MRDVALFVKSCRPDLVLVHRLLASISILNRERIGILISAPEADPAYAPCRDSRDEGLFRDAHQAGAPRRLPRAPERAS
jgi:hypothetical protein